MSTTPTPYTPTDEEATARFKVESKHQVHGAQCTCGFESQRARSRTEHLMEAYFAELGTHSAARDARVRAEAVETTDAEVLAALEEFDGFNVRTWGTAPMSPRTSLDQHAPLHVERMRAVLRAARAASIEQETQP